MIAPAPGATVLAAKDLRAELGARVVLHSVALSLRAGELLVVLGANGAGKTTLLRALAGVLPVQGGAIDLFGRPLHRWSRREVARRLAVVPQDLTVEFPYRVREMVAMGRAPHLGPFAYESAEDWAVVEAALRELGLEGLAERVYPTLSAGERQRVALARARAQAAPVWLLDEPTAHMDLGHRLFTFEWLRARVRGSEPPSAALVVTHELSLAARFADRVVVLCDGSVAADGTPSEALSRETLERIYQIEVQVTPGPESRPDIVAVRSRIDYTVSRR
jgi:iron complex transport system ATP-binding protein